MGFQSECASILLRQQTNHKLDMAHQDSLKKCFITRANMTNIDINIDREKAIKSQEKLSEKQALMSGGVSSTGMIHIVEEYTPATDLVARI